jgi:crossover junction endodeoxyribonuclease RusA
MRGQARGATRRPSAPDPALRDMFGLPAELPAGYGRGAAGPPATTAKAPARRRRPRPPAPVVVFRGADDPTPTLPPCSCTTSRLKTCPRHNPNRIRRMPPIRLDAPEPVRLVLPFDRPPLTANEARAGDTGHWGAQSRAKLRVHDAVADAVEVLPWLPTYQRCAVELTWHAPDRARRDPDGLGPFLKACLDGLKNAGVIEDDDASVIEYVAMRILLASHPARMVLRVIPV